jgi:hypothetical protein
VLAAVLAACVLNLSVATMPRADVAPIAVDGPVEEEECLFEQLCTLEIPGLPQLESNTFELLDGMCLPEAPTTCTPQQCSATNPGLSDAELDELFGLLDEFGGPLPEDFEVKTELLFSRSVEVRVPLTTVDALCTTFFVNTMQPQLSRAERLVNGVVLITARLGQLAGRLAGLTKWAAKWAFLKTINGIGVGTLHFIDKSSWLRLATIQNKIADKAAKNKWDKVKEAAVMVRALRRIGIKYKKGAVVGALIALGIYGAKYIYDHVAGMSKKVDDMNKQIDELKKELAEKKCPSGPYDRLAEAAEKLEALQKLRAEIAKAATPEQKKKLQEQFDADKKALECDYKKELAILKAIAQAKIAIDEMERDIEAIEALKKMDIPEKPGEGALKLEGDEDAVTDEEIDKAIEEAEKEIAAEGGK